METSSISAIASIGLENRLEPTFKVRVDIGWTMSTRSISLDPSFGIVLVGRGRNVDVRWALRRHGERWVIKSIWAGGVISDESVCLTDRRGRDVSTSSLMMYIFRYYIPPFVSL